jgi:methionine-rich copper-binding protein CopC
VRRILTSVLAISVVLLAGFTSAPAAAASDALVASDPAPRQELDAPPGGITLAFDRDLELGSVKVLVLAPDGRNVVVGDLDYFGSSVALFLEPDLPRATYTVRYRLEGADGEPEGGAYQFSVGPGQWTDPLPDESWAGTDEQPPDLANPDPQATGPAATEAPSETPGIDLGTPTPSTSSATTDSPAPTPTATESPTSSPQPAEPGNDWSPWLVGGAIVLVAAGVGAWLVARNRRAG